MQYNTQKSNIEIAEYGRNIQALLLRANDIIALDERLAYTEKVLDAMYALNPQVRITEDYRSKLWSHAFRITNYTLQVEPPEGIVLDSNDDFFHKKPKPLPYPTQVPRLRHYGKNIVTLIQKAAATTDPIIRTELTNSIASFMKMAQINYNREGISDDIIRRDLHELSGATLSLDAEADIQDIARGNRVVLEEKLKTRRGKRGGKNKKVSTQSTPVKTAAPIVAKSTPKNTDNNTANNTAKNAAKNTGNAAKSTVNNTANNTKNVAKNVAKQPQKTATPASKIVKNTKPAVVTPKTPAPPPPTINNITPAAEMKKRRRGSRGRGGKGKTPPTDA